MVCSLAPGLDLPATMMMSTTRIFPVASLPRRTPAAARADRRTLQVYSAEGKVLVLGGTGFVGTEVCKQALQAGYDVVALSRRGIPQVSGFVHLHSGFVRPHPLGGFRSSVRCSVLPVLVAALNHQPSPVCRGPREAA